MAELIPQIEAVDQLLRRQALRREPAARVGEGCGGDGDHSQRSHERSKALRGVGRGASGNVRSPSDNFRGKASTKSGAENIEACDLRVAPFRLR